MLSTAVRAAAIAAALSFAMATTPSTARDVGAVADPDCNVTMPCRDVGPTSRGLWLRARLPFGEPVQRNRRSAVHGLVDEAAAAAGVPVRIAHAVVRHESKYRPEARGRAGEWGLGQIKCQTARGVGFSGPCRQLADPATNLTYSMRYLRQALDRGGEGCAGVSLYQRGLFGRRGCSAYGRQVLAHTHP